MLLLLLLLLQRSNPGASRVAIAIDAGVRIEQQAGVLLLRELW